MDGVLTRDEALTVFRGWERARALLRCECRFAGFVSVCDARVVIVDDEELRCIGDDNRTEFVLHLRRPLAFWSVGIEDTPNEKYRRIVAVFPPFDRDDVRQADQFLLAEIVE